YLAWRERRACGNSAGAERCRPPSPPAAVQQACGHDLLHPFLIGFRRIFLRWPRLPRPHSCSEFGLEANPVIVRKPQILLLSLAVPAALIGCKHEDTPSAPATAAAHA